MAPKLTLASLTTKASLSAALQRLESAAEEDDTLELLSAAYRQPRAHVLGITGPPGVGKSTLVNVLIKSWREQKRTVACIAVDPSSRRSGGALLGDRTRFTVDPLDAGVFVRSMAARDKLGGLAALTVPAMVIMRALYDLVLIETVGVGQSETGIARVADTVVFCVQPGSGDSLQFMKAGIVEIPHVVAVTKADIGARAELARTEVAGALHLAAAEDSWAIPVLSVSAERAQGIDALMNAIDDHAQYVLRNGGLAARRHSQAEQYVVETVGERFGREGLKRAGRLALAPDEDPFHRVAAVSETLTARWS
jgi:LAO/AO transport system kinase